MLIQTLASIPGKSVGPHAHEDYLYVHHYFLSGGHWKPPFNHIPEPEILNNQENWLQWWRPTVNQGRFGWVFAIKIHLLLFSETLQNQYAPLSLSIRSSMQTEASCHLSNLCILVLLSTRVVWHPLQYKKTSFRYLFPNQSNVVALLMLWEF